MLSPNDPFISHKASLSRLFSSRKSAMSFACTYDFSKKGYINWNKSGMDVFVLAIHLGLP